MTAKRSKISTRSAIVRSGDRNSVTMSGRCQVGDRPEQEVDVMDLDPHGCRLRGVTVGVTKVEPLRIWLGPLGPVAAHLKWAKRGSVGIGFDVPLDPDVVEGLPKHAPTSTVVALRRSSLR